MKKIFISLFLTSINITNIKAESCPANWVCPENPILSPDTKIGAWYSLYFYNPGSKPVDHWKETR